MQFWLNFIVARYSVIGNKYVSLHSDKKYRRMMDKSNLKSASNLNGNLNCSKELEHYE